MCEGRSGGSDVAGSCCVWRVQIAQSPELHDEESSLAWRCRNGFRQSKERDRPFLDPCIGFPGWT